MAEGERSQSRVSTRVYCRTARSCSTSFPLVGLEAGACHGEVGEGPRRPGSAFSACVSQAAFACREVAQGAFAGARQVDGVDVEVGGTWVPAAVPQPRGKVKPSWLSLEIAYSSVAAPDSGRHVGVERAADAAPASLTTAPSSRRQQANSCDTFFVQPVIPVPHEQLIVGHPGGLALRLFAVALYRAAQRVAVREHPQRHHRSAAVGQQAETGDVQGQLADRHGLAPARCNPPQLASFTRFDRK